MKWFVPWLQKSMGIQMYWLTRQMLCLKYIKRVLFRRNYPSVYYIRGKLFLCPPHEALGSSCLFSWVGPHACADITVRALVRFHHPDPRLAALDANHRTEYAWGPKLEADHYIPNRNIHSWNKISLFILLLTFTQLRMEQVFWKWTYLGNHVQRKNQNKTIMVRWPKQSSWLLYSS